MKVDILFIVMHYNAFDSDKSVRFAIEKLPGKDYH